VIDFGSPLAAGLLFVLWAVTRPLRPERDAPPAEEPRRTPEDAPNSG